MRRLRHQPPGTPVNERLKRGILISINGIAAGGGYELALAADHIILVDDGSSAVSLPEVPLQPLAQQVRQLEDALAYTGQPLAEAERREINAAIGDPDEVRVGDPVVAIGNQLGQGTKVTQGKVTGLNQDVTFNAAASTPAIAAATVMASGPRAINPLTISFKPSTTGLRAGARAPPISSG